MKEYKIDILHSSIDDFFYFQIGNHLFKYGKYEKNLLKLSLMKTPASVYSILDNIIQKLHDKYIVYNKGQDGSITIMYILNLEIHRENGPAVIRFDKNGSTLTYFNKGLIHRYDGPAFMHYDANGQLTLCSYYQNGEWSKPNCNKK